MPRYALAVLPLAGTLCAQPQEAIDRYSELGSKIIMGMRPRTRAKASPVPPALAVSALPPAEVITSHVEKLKALTAEVILETLRAKPDITPDALRKVILNLQDNLWFPEERLAPREIPRVYSARVGPTEVLIVGFGVLSGGSAIPAVHSHLLFLVRTPQGWEQRAVAPDELGELLVEIEPLPSPFLNEVWVLAWGKRLGDNGGRLSARLFVFDGSEVRSIWARNDLAGGTLEVQQNRVVLEYEDRSNRDRPRPVREELYVVATGLL